MTTVDLLTLLPFYPGIYSDLTGELDCAIAHFFVLYLDPTGRVPLGGQCFPGITATLFPTVVFALVIPSSCTFLQCRRFWYLLQLLPYLIPGHCWWCTPPYLLTPQLNWTVGWSGLCWPRQLLPDPTYSTIYQQLIVMQFPVILPWFIIYWFINYTNWLLIMTTLVDHPHPYHYYYSGGGV